ncbi:hypothetical protein PIB30_042944 [Stylosanthes scabra]|uniref:F-box domain-containing protein n=1 Tax=Stylosanthes scabra TaxID=79078 RepID=A0ABU6YCR8_9FABA|nr:hypothetical protein [Stylosanthes scabra]
MAPSSSSSPSPKNSRYEQQWQPHLPDECWESIFKHLNNPYDHESLSLVSKHFPFHHQPPPHQPHRLPPHPPSPSCPPPPLHQPHHHKIGSYYTGDINAVLSQIASFDLPSLHSLDISNHRSCTFLSHGLREFSKKFPTLKSLNCSWTQQDLVLIAECFPNLEEINVRYPKPSVFPDADLQVKALTSGLKMLRKVDLSGTNILGNSSIFTFCQNCVFLEELFVDETGSLSNIGIANAIRQRPQLRSLAVRSKNVTYELIDALVCLKDLTCLDLPFAYIYDEALCALAEQGLPLRKLSLRGCMGCG